MAKRNLDVNKACVVRDRPCGRIFSCSNTCFIACPSSDEVGFELDSIKTALEREEIEPYIAVQHFEPAKEIFCTKICTKIIESKFCVVLLSGATNPGGTAVPNPNVYYEYGVMTAWKKFIIPLQRSDDRLAFNIQSLDTLKYTPASFKGQFEQALRMAITWTEQTEETDNELADILTLYFELRGLPRHKKSWTVENTHYAAFDRFNYATVVQSVADVERIVYDTKAVIRRLERYIADLDVKFRGIEKSHGQADTTAKKEGTKAALTKVDWQRDVASHPTFTIVLMQPEAKAVLNEKIESIESSLASTITLLSYEEMKAEMERL